MKNIKPTLLVIFLAALLGLSSCKTNYSPQLKCRTDDIVNQLRDPYNFENVDLSAEASLEFSGKHDRLFIKLTNGANIPQDYTAAISLAKVLLKKILPDVYNADKYDSYEVSFITTKTIGSNTQTDEMAMKTKFLSEEKLFDKEKENYRLHSVRSMPLTHLRSCNQWLSFPRRQ